MKPNVKKSSDSCEEFTLGEEALIRQWLEYRKVVLDRYRMNSQQSTGPPLSVFQELNSHLKNASYLAGNKFSKADVEVLSGLLEFYGPQSIQTKEKYPYLSRWFTHISHLSHNELSITIPFSRSSLY
uniref:Nuclear-export cofactor Arc1-like N-terminal domain-containing protein n=1 Tax=Daphnia galeata TaxID=27404 RepID=A0A8J2RXR3_9CRUS|nr:unnamed protein product [Daphnia galeata]